MRTDGQIVYEHKHPRYIQVVHTNALPFVTAGDVMTIQNPNFEAPWHLLTEACRQRWEKYAVGHHLVSKGEMV